MGAVTFAVVLMSRVGGDEIRVVVQAENRFAALRFKADFGDVFHLLPEAGDTTIRRILDFRQGRVDRRVLCSFAFAQRCAPFSFPCAIGLFYPPIVTLAVSLHGPCCPFVFVQRAM